MIRSRRGAAAASLVGALLIIGGAPTIAFGGEDAVHERVAVQSADTTSGDVAAQKAKDDDAEKEAEKKDDAKKDGDKKDAKNNGGEKKKDGDKKQASDKKKDSDSKQAAEKKKADDKKDADKKKDGDNKQASERKRHENAKNDGKKNDGKHDGKKNDGKHDGKKDDGKHDGKKHDGKDGDHKDHKDKHNKNWDHNRDRDRHDRHGWDTHRRYYDYGYYGPGYYDDCGYYGSDYDGRSSDYSYYGPDACGYEYGGYQSHFLVDMSWDQVIPRTDHEAYGTANLDIDVPAGEVCFRLAYDGVERAIGAQIHPGRVGEVGPSIVLLHVGQNGDDGCVSADPQILSEIQNDPRGYYLEVNDEEYGQAMRGQLDAPDYRNRY